ncbi:MAG: hypothetical protein OCD76_04085 [Reichenbachiella sp.]
MIFTTKAHAQSSEVCLEVKGRVIQLADSLIVDPQSVSVQGDDAFKFDQSNNQITFDEPTQTEVCFRVLPIYKGIVNQNKSMDLYDSTVSFYDKNKPLQPGYEKEELFSTPDIYKSGSLTRGVSFGNTQSVNVLSNFNFQMDGKLTENLNVRADITDQNVPFQPEGNTQQIREFDNVTFEVYNDDLSIKAGDVLLNSQDGYFMKYNKNGLGGLANVKYNLSKNVKATTSLAIASAKGQFADVTVEAQEGLQGPYQLKGPNGEQFVVVLANSEQVYLDGRLLKRGFNHDYVIDYNLGELIFNPNVLITQFSRIRVTYEYSDQNYSRSIIVFNQNVKAGQHEFNVGYYREKDDPNRPLAFTLTNEDKEAISEAGDDEIPVPIDASLLTNYSDDVVLYERMDTLSQDGELTSVYQYSRDSTAELYRVSFTNVGQGKGNYVLLQNDVNGRVYEWTSPLLGQSQGDYAAIRFVPAPNSRQLVTLASNIRISPYTQWYTEVAFSNQDLNLYADKGNEDNNGMAFKSGVRLQDLPIKFLNGYKISTDLNYEYDAANFEVIDRYRPIEFDRNWSYDVERDTFETSDNIINVITRLEKDVNNQLIGRYTMRNKANVIDGYQHEEKVKKSFGQLKLLGSHFYMKNENPLEKSQWRRWSGETYFDRFFVVPGYRFEEDRNEVSNAPNDSLIRTAMNYQSHKFYLRNRPESKIRYNFDYVLREDQQVSNGVLLPFTYSRTSSANVNATIFKDHIIDLVFTYRELDYQGEYDDLEDEKLILGKAFWRGSFMKRHLRTDMSYTTSSSQEILKEYIYVQVGTGEGTHTWRDLNGDGVQDLTEFFEAVNFDERNYIKVFVPTTERIEAFNTIFNFTINIAMPRSWRSQGSFKQVLSKFSNNTNVNINKKTTDDGFDARFNPFSLDISDERLVFVRDAIRSSFFYNRSGKGLGADFTISTKSAKQLVSRGIDSRYNLDYLSNIRYHLNSDWMISLGGNLKEKENASQFNEDRNYLINTKELIPGLIWQPKNNLRFSTIYQLSYKENEKAMEMTEKSETNTIRLESRWSNGVKNSLNGSFSYSHIAFEGDENTAAAYELLNALQPGENYSWQLNYNQKLLSGLQLNIGYEGRKSPNSKFIHQGRMQVVALF